MKHKLTLKQRIPLDQLECLLRNITFRGVYNTSGQNVLPYEKTKFNLAQVFPPKALGLSAEIEIKKKLHPLFTPQPTIYQNQVEIMETVDTFLKQHCKLKLNELTEGVEYHWEGRGDFHVLPPIIEKHTYYLREGSIDLDYLTKRFDGMYVKDARGNLHHLGSRTLHSFYIDELSKLEHLETFNSNAPIINYGLQYSGPQTFYIICDGSHRIDYALEKLNKPITVLVVEPKNSRDTLPPYYAFPSPLRPTLRLSSKKAERMYHHLERDKIHLLNDFIKKTLHYNWESAGLSVSKLRSNVEIY